MIPDDPEQIDEETFRCGKCKRISFYTEQGKDDLCVNCTLDLYPHTPGAKRTGTSKLAADSMRERAPTLRDRVLSILKLESLTADEVAQNLAQSILSIRPRLSELLALGKIVETSERRRNQSGKLATVWRAV